MKTEENEPEYTEVTISDVKMLVEKTIPGEYKIVRLISTDPQEFLRQDIQPGMIINHTAINKTVEY